MNNVRTTLRALRTHWAKRGTMREADWEEQRRPLGEAYRVAWEEWYRRNYAA